MGIRIDALPAAAAATLTHRVPSMKDNATVYLTVGQILDLVLGSPPGALDTLDELAAALGDDANFAATVTAALAAKANSADTTINALTGKTTPVDADEFRIADSAASYASKKLSFANLKAALFVNANMLAGSVVQAISATPYTSNTNITTAIPFDDTIPQSSEGTQILSATITPRSTTNIIRARFRGNGTLAAPGQIIAAMFKAGTANAIVATYAACGTADFEQQLMLEHEFVPGSVSPLTISVNVGPSSGTLRMNGSTAQRYLGGVSTSTLIIEEIKA